MLSLGIVVGFSRMLLSRAAEYVSLDALAEVLLLFIYNWLLTRERLHPLTARAGWTNRSLMH